MALAVPSVLLLSAPITLDVLRPDIPDVPTCTAEQVPSPNRTLTPEQRRTVYSLACSYRISLSCQPDLWLAMSNATPLRVRQEVVQVLPDVELLAAFVSSLLCQENTLKMLLDTWNIIGVEALLTLIWHADLCLRVDSGFIYLFPNAYHHYAIPHSFLMRLHTPEACYYFAELVRRKHLFTTITTSRDRTDLIMDGFCYNPELRAMINRVQLSACVIHRSLQPQNTKKHRTNVATAMNTLERELITSPNLFLVPLSVRERAQFVALRDICAQKTVQLSRIAPFTHQYDIGEEVDDFLPAIIPQPQQQQQAAPPVPGAEAAVPPQAPKTNGDNVFEEDDPFADPIGVDSARNVAPKLEDDDGAARADQVDCGEDDDDEEDDEDEDEDDDDEFANDLEQNLEDEANDTMQTT